MVWLAHHLNCAFQASPLTSRWRPSGTLRRSSCRIRPAANVAWMRTRSCNFASRQPTSSRRWASICECMCTRLYLIGHRLTHLGLLSPTDPLPLVLLVPFQVPAVHQHGHRLHAPLLRVSLVHALPSEWNSGGQPVPGGQGELFSSRRRDGKQMSKQTVLPSRSKSNRGNWSM